MGRPKFNPWVGKIPWRREWQPLQYSCLKNSGDRGAWRATVHGVAESRTRLMTNTFTFTLSSCCLETYPVFVLIQFLSTLHDPAQISA